MTDPNGSAAGGQPGADSGAGAGGGGGGAAAAPWYGADAGDDIKGFVELKGWSEPKAAIDSYRNLEKLMGADKAGRAIVLPKDDADADGWKAFNTRIGVPEKADGYKLPVPEGDNGEFAKSIAPILHEAGLTTRQAEKLATRWNEMQAATNDRLNQQIEQQIKDDQAALAREWGAAAGQKAEIASRAANVAGLSQDDVADMVAALGYAKTQKFLAAMGERMGEDKFVGADGKPAASAFTPAAAKARLEQLMGDKEWLNKFASGNADALAEKQRLDEAILVGKQAA